MWGKLTDDQLDVIAGRLAGKSAGTAVSAYLIGGSSATMNMALS